CARRDDYGSRYYFDYW
nr:immunoglobulin heavy chain junction region [Mus musculus]